MHKEYIIELGSRSTFTELQTLHYKFLYRESDQYSKYYSIVDIDINPEAWMQITYHAINRSNFEEVNTFWTVEKYKERYG